MKLSIFVYLTGCSADFGFGRPTRGKRGRFAENEIQKAATVLEKQLSYKTIQKYMDFEGYEDKDWKIDFDGIVRSFLVDDSSPKEQRLAKIKIRYFCWFQKNSIQMLK